MPGAQDLVHQYQGCIYEDLFAYQFVFNFLQDQRIKSCCLYIVLLQKHDCLFEAPNMWLLMLINDHQ